MVARAEHDELVALDRSLLGAGGAAASEHVGEALNVGVPRNRQLGARGERHVRVGDRCVRDARPVEAGDVAGDEADQRAAVVGGEQS